MRPHLAVLGLLLLTGCAASTPTVVPGSAVTTSATPVPPASSTAAMPSTPVPITAPVRASSTAPVRASSTAPVQASSTARARATQQVVLRPVTNTGRLAPGYRLVVEPTAEDQLNCGGSAPAASPSPVAVDDGIALCYPAAAYAVACWPGPTPITAWCFGDPWQRQVQQIDTQGPLANVRAPRNPSPLGLELSDGTRCRLRIGGTGEQLDGHPGMSGRYECDHEMDLWGLGPGDGIDRSAPTWTVRLASMSGHGALSTVAVGTAYYVGTATP